MAARAPACGGIRSLVGLGVRTYRSADRTGAQCTPVASSGRLAAELNGGGDDDGDGDGRVVSTKGMVRDSAPI
jgi:hypothetical protein